MKNLKAQAWLLGPLLVGLIILIIQQYFGTSDPILWINPPGYQSYHCYPNGFSGENFEYKMYLSNRAETPAISQVCFYADNVNFTIDNNIYENEVCYTERIVDPKSSDLAQIYGPVISINSPDKTNNISIKMESSCSYKILSLIPKKCEKLTHVCDYKKSNYGNKYDYVR